MDFTKADDLATFLHAVVVLLQNVVFVITRPQLFPPLDDALRDRLVGEVFRGSLTISNSQKKPEEEGMYCRGVPGRP